MTIAFAAIVSPATAQGLRAELGPEAGVSLQTDEYIAGARLVVGSRAVPYVRMGRLTL